MLALALAALAIVLTTWPYRRLEGPRRRAAKAAAARELVLTLARAVVLFRQDADA